MCGRMRNFNYDNANVSLVEAIDEFMNEARTHEVRSGNIGEPVRRVEFEPLPPVEVPTTSPAEAPAETPSEPVPV